MPKDLEDIYKKLEQNNKSNGKEVIDIIKSINVVGKDNDKILKEISDVKKEVKDIAFKVDLMLEILNNFSLMLSEDDEDLEQNYEFDNDTDETWVPKDEDFWEDDDAA
jgi:hypothetical protein